MFVFFLIMWIFGSLISAIILNSLAKKVGKIEGVKYGKSLLVALSASLIVGILYFILSSIIMDSPMEFMQMFGDMGFFGALILSIIIMCIGYFPMGKILWKCSWVASIKANSVWIIIYAIISSIAYGKMSSMIENMM